MTFSIEQAMEEFFSGGGGTVAYGGTGLSSGAITGNPTGGSTNVTTTPGGSQVVTGESNFDENGNVIYLDYHIYAPHYTNDDPSAYDRFMHDLDDIEHDIHSFIYGEYANDGSHGSYDDPIFHLKTLDELFPGNGSTNTGTGVSADNASAPKISATFGSFGNDLLTGNDVLHGGGGNDTVMAGSGADAVFGGTGDDHLFGGAGDDVLIGGWGNDVLNGGDGSDTVAYNDTPYGVTVNLADASQNTGAAVGDTYTGIENVIGSSAGDKLVGTWEANRLDGGAGNDMLIGGWGNDTLVGGDGTDTVVYNDTPYGVAVDLADSSHNGGAAAGDVLTGIENVYGSSAADSLSGDAQANRLDGWDGNDTLNGAGGNDTLVGGTGSDIFIFTAALSTANVAHIADFMPGADRLVLDHHVFAGLALGGLDPAAFAVGAAVNTAQHVLYDAGTGALSYDADGVGGQAAVTFAMLTPHLALNAASFLVI